MLATAALICNTAVNESRKRMGDGMRTRGEAPGSRLDYSFEYKKADGNSCYDDMAASIAITWDIQQQE